MSDEEHWKHKFENLLHVTVDALLVMRLRKMYLISPERFKKRIQELSDKVDDIVLETDTKKGE